MRANGIRLRSIKQSPINIEVNHKFFHWAKETEQGVTTLITSDRFRLYTGAIISDVRTTIVLNSQRWMKFTCRKKKQRPQKSRYGYLRSKMKRSGPAVRRPTRKQLLR